MRDLRSWLLVAAVAGLAVVAWWATRRGEGRPRVVESRPVGVMGTECSLIAVLPPASGPAGGDPLAAAEAELRRLEALFSTWIDASEISGLNRAPAGEEVSLSRESREVLRLARRLHAATGGAFDVTSAPLIDLWRQAAETRRLPSPDELDMLRGASGWQDLEITERGAIKRRATLRVDVDGIAKGYAIDRALAALRGAGAAGGLVEVGGDLRVFGRPAAGETWQVAVYDPFAQRAAGRIEIGERAVCTSGGYARFVEIEGRRYSHILDPRTGRPAEAAASATVLAADAATADAWATALSVLGLAGLEELPAGIDALLLIAGEDGPRGVATPGFPELAGDGGIPIRRAG